MVKINRVGWDEAKLIDLISSNGIFSDGDWIESKDQDPNGSIRLIQLADIGDGKFLDKSSRYVNEEKFFTLNCEEIFENDVLIARMPDPLGRACVLQKLSQRCITVVDVAILRPGINSVLPKWLMHFINAPEIRQTIDLLSTGTTRKRISRSNLEQISIPVPPLNEQKRIADKLEMLLARVDACRDHLDRVEEILKRFRQAVLSAAVSGKLTEDWREENILEESSLQFRPMMEYEDKDLPELPETWGWYRFGDVADIESNLVDPQKYQDFPHIAPNYIESQTGRLLPYGTITSDKVISGNHLFKPGRIIYSKIRPYLCKAALVDFTGLCSADMYPINGKFVSTRYLHKWMISQQFTTFASSQQGRTVLPKINQIELNKIPVPVPPEIEQIEIVRRVSILFKLADNLEARFKIAYSRVENLTTTLLAKAFSGQLVPQDTNDEPASLLLERIKVEQTRQINQLESARKNTAPRETKMTEASLKDIILKLPSDTFSFDDLYKEAPGDYELLKENLFKLLSETDAIITQVFDPSVNAIRFVRRSV